MFKAVENLNVHLIGDYKAKAYDYLSKKDGKQKKGIAISMIGLVDDEENDVRNVVIINMNNVAENLVYREGVYTLTAPTSFFKRQFINGQNVHTVSFSADSDVCSFRPVTKK